MVTDLKKNGNKGDDHSIFKCRYIVAFMEFLAFFEINVYRIATSMSIVAMVNNTAITSQKVFNNGTVSCPLNYSDETDYSLQENNGEFNWSPSLQGYILGSSYLGFVITLIPGGMLAEIYGAKSVILFGLFFSTVNHLLSPLAARSSSYLMIVVQLLRGMGQGLIPAALSVLSTKWFPRSERGILNSLVLLGYSFGTLITGVSSGAMCSLSLLGGWPSLYLIYGVLGLIFCICFHFIVFESPMCHSRISDTELTFILKDQESVLSLKRPPIPWKSILTSVPVYAMTYAIFGVYWVVAHILTIQPIFFDTILHFSIQENGLFISVPFLFQVILTFMGSWISKLLNTNNYVGLDKVRKGSNLLFCLGYSLSILGVYYAGCERTLSAVFTIAALSFIALSFSGSLITPLDMSPAFAGTLMGFSYTIGSLSSFIFPVVVGIMTNEKQTLEEWNKIFFICIGVIMSSGLIFCFFGSAEVQPWNYANTEHTEKTRPPDNNLKEQVADKIPS